MNRHTSIAFGQRCKRAGIRTSMGSVGDCYDNALCESCFATLECELIDRYQFCNHGRGSHCRLEFIEGWYNPHRLHSALDYQSPMEYEMKYQAHTTQPSP